MTTSQEIRFGIIGSGGIARRFAQGLAHVDGAKLTQVWNRSAQKAQDFVGDFGGHVAESVESLLASDIDAVYIATPHTRHAQYSIAALAAGKAVLCEKPAAVSLGELEAVLAQAAVSGKLFMEAMKPPFYPLYRKLRETLLADPIGPVQFVRTGFSIPDVEPDSRLYQPDLAGGGLLDVGVYGVFLSVDWLGAAKDVQVQGRVAAGVDTFAAINSQHHGGWSQVYCGLGLSGAGDAMLAAANGHVVIHEKWWHPERATICYTDGRKVELHEPAEGGGLNYETAHFCELLRTGKLQSPVLSHETSRSMIRLLDHAREGLGVVYPFERGVIGSI
ncbi:Gfo/Idh/MocA family oxidoreductase [Silvimonas sp.]|uniref:Gfo/Idh/MocA family protein n=1 Tax=Silvimonas sp. TaxID=2650811 RepID=UPI00284F4618|nr:Gfo/Idh/MocA family oxidoreductase [Silvimonas sp.]MDR3429722.1 Gfo/Idh/MocA family oxidoreductase [Silvimonas sp.]